MRYFFIIFYTLVCFTLFSQSDSTKSNLLVSGYLETYYSYDFSNPSNHTKPDFIYSFNRHNEFNLNLGFIKANYESKNLKANLAFMTGTYSNANLSSEFGVFKNIYEANVDVKISKIKKLFVTAGIFPSHIGFESAVGKDCWNLTRSILADNSPYYESGAKLSFTSKNDKWFLSALILNGWQRISRVDGNNTPAFGHQITYKPSDKIIVNSSSFIGNTFPDNIRQMRYFHNFYTQYLINKKLGFIFGFDFGVQQKSKGNLRYNNWYSPVLIAKYSPNSKISIAARGEYYSDENQVIITTNTKNGFQTFGYSLNLDYNLSENVVWRLEGKGYSSRDKLFLLDKNASNFNYCLSTALAISF
jgi:hypothetical protein